MPELDEKVDLLEYSDKSKEKTRKYAWNIQDL
jgi:hypothetical protein